MNEIEPLHVLVRFGNGVPIDERNAALLAFEKMLRHTTGLRIEVFGERKGDDSKLRAVMTQEQRAKL